MTRRRPLQIDPVYWEIKFPVSAREFTATYYAELPTRFTRIVGNVSSGGVELVSLKIGQHEQLAVSPVDLWHFPTHSTNTLLLETANKQYVKLDVRVRHDAGAKALVIGPPYNGSHRVYRLEDRASDEYVILVEGVAAQETKPKDPP